VLAQKLFAHLGNAIYGRTPKPFGRRPLGALRSNIMVILFPIFIYPVLPLTLVWTPQTTVAAATRRPSSAPHTIRPTPHPRATAAGINIPTPPSPSTRIPRPTCRGLTTILVRVYSPTTTSRSFTFTPRTPAPIQSPTTTAAASNSRHSPQRLLLVQIRKMRTNLVHRCGGKSRLGP